MNVPDESDNFSPSMGLGRSKCRSPLTDHVLSASSSSNMGALSVVQPLQPLYCATPPSPDDDMEN